MYTQIFFVTSVRGMVLPPQIAANAGLNAFGAFVMVVFVVFGATVLVVVVIAIEEWMEVHT